MYNMFHLIYKPSGITSSKLSLFVSKGLIKQGYTTSNVGHSGSLDPFATGVLLLGVNKAKKFFQYLPKIKEYYFDIEFGYSTDTDDKDGKIINQNDCLPDIEDLRNVLLEFIGTITQIPSKFSAIKIDGTRAYKLARKGVDFEMKSREIEIYELELLSYVGSIASLRVKCVSGTYIRTLAADICKKLNVLGCLIRLYRFMNHTFIPKEECSIEEIPLNCFLDFYEAKIFSFKDLLKLKNGVRLRFQDDVNYVNNTIFCAVDSKNDFFGLVLKDGDMFFPLCMV